MKIKVVGLDSGRYYLNKNELSFNIGSFYEQILDGGEPLDEHKLILDDRSALNIANALLDKYNLFGKDEQDLLALLEEKISCLEERIASKDGKNNSI